MSEIDPRLASALAVQLENWRATLAEGAERVGWKLGIGDRERIGRELAIGHLTSATCLEAGGTYSAGSAVDLRADAEIALHIGRDVDRRADLSVAQDAVSGFGAALELVDLGRPANDPEAVVATNVFHRAFVLGPSQRELPVGLEAALIVNGELRASASAPEDFSDSVYAVARALGALGERLQAGDRIITGSVVQVGVEPGDEVVADLGGLGRLQLLIEP